MEIYLNNCSSTFTLKEKETYNSYKELHQKAIELIKNKENMKQRDLTEQYVCIEHKFYDLIDPLKLYHSAHIRLLREFLQIKNTMFDDILMNKCSDLSAF
jgi:hypothetical protein